MKSAQFFLIFYAILFSFACQTSKNSKALSLSFESLRWEGESSVVTPEDSLVLEGTVDAINRPQAKFSILDLKGQAVSMSAANLQVRPLELSGDSTLTFNGKNIRVEAGEGACNGK